jgi:hypothetical protein
VVNSILPPALDPLPFVGSSLQSYAPQASRPLSNGVGHNHSISDSTRLNRRKKCWKTRVDKPSCILGRDIALDRVLGLAEKALVGKFFYARMSMRQLTEWMLSYWKPILGYCPRFSLLANHWLVFHFLSESDLLCILGSPWIFGKGVLMLKRWCPRFNPHLENFRKRSFWMLLPDFPLEYWSIWVFEAIANSVGKFIFFDELALRKHNKRIVWLLVELDLDRGLPDTIDITIGDDHFLQMVNFWKEPFSLPCLMANEASKDKLSIFHGSPTVFQSLGDGLCFF